MLFFKKFLKNNSKFNQSCILISFLFNVVVVSFFTMTIFGISNITEDVLSNSDVEQISYVISSIMIIGSISIIFIQWSIWLLYDALFESRISFNRNITMIGVSAKKLFVLYFGEFIVMQIIILPVSIMFSFLFYDKLVSIYNIESKISFIYIQYSYIIAFISSLVSLCYSFNKNKSYNSYKITLNKKSSKNFNSYILKFLKLIYIFIIISYIFTSLIKRTMEFYILFLFLLIPIVYLWKDILITILETIIKILPIKYHNIINIIKGNINQVKRISLTIILGIVMVFSLNTFIGTARNYAYNNVIENINYDKAILFNEMFYDNTNTNDYTTGLLFNENNIGSSNLTVLGVSQDYLTSYESIHFKHTKENDFYEKINDEDYNGIILPNHLLKDDDIGNKITLNINNQSLDFVIVDSYYTNDYSAMFAYTSKAYIQKELSLKDMVNIIFIINDDKITINNNAFYLSRTKEDLAKESYNKVLQSTFILEISAFVVLLVSFFTLTNFIIITSRKNKIDIARMRCIGVSKQDINLMYIMTYVMVVLISLIPSFILSFRLSMLLTEWLLKIPKLSYQLVFSWEECIYVSFAYIIYILICYFFLTKTTYKNYIETIRLKISD